MEKTEKVIHTKCGTFTVTDYGQPLIPREKYKIPEIEEPKRSMFELVFGIIACSAIIIASIVWIVVYLIKP